MPIEKPSATAPGRRTRVRLQEYVGGTIAGRPGDPLGLAKRETPAIRSEPCAFGEQGMPIALDAEQGLLQ